MQSQIVQSMRKKTSRLLIIVVMLIAVLFGGAFIYYNENLKATGSAEEKVTVLVEEGTSYQGLFKQLENEGLIHSTLVAKVYLKLNSVAPLQANSYELNKGMSLPEIIDIVSSGNFDYLVKTQMTVPEGLTLPEVAEIVANTIGTTKSDVLSLWDNPGYVQKLAQDYWFLNADEVLQDGVMHPLEGYLYPETYTISTAEPTIDEITRMMLKLTDEALTKYQDGISALGFTPHEFLAFASVVERESLFDEDRPKIAEVFINRLQIGMNLQSDITVLYALQRTGVDLTIQEINETDSHYNTYLYAGLPIGPISNVSDATMKSCVEHDDHDYLYFYACQDGTVLYASTYAEHEANVRANPWD